METNSGYRWMHLKNGTGCAAIVTLDVYKNSFKTNKIVECYSGKGFTSQGHIEDVSELGYDSWKIAARNGLEYAFSLLDNFWTVHIKNIQGRDLTDTNAATVGYTTMLAFFDKVDYKLDPKKMNEFQDLVSQSWTKPFVDYIPDFFALTLTEYNQ